MFTEPFHLNALPFEENIEADRILDDERFTQALDRLAYFAGHGLVALLTGPTGVGKSCLLERFLHTLPAHRYQPLYLHISRVDAAAMLRMIVTALGERPSLGRDRLFRQILARASLADLLNRVCVRCALRPLSKEQTLAYIDRRLKAAGGAETLFDSAAKEIIHEHTGGVPRAINILATTCLIHAASRQLKRIGEALVVEAAAEMRLL